jgi:hypothetical protein
MKRSLLLPVLALWVLAGCAGLSPAPRQTPPAGEGASQTSPAGADSPSAKGGPLANVEPCDLVSVEDADSLNLVEGNPTNIGRARACRFRLEGPTIRQTFTISVVIFDDIPPNGLTPLKRAKPVTMGKHTGTAGETAAGCAVTLGVGESSTLEVDVVGSDLERQCQLATKLATLIEPKLP